MSRRYRRGTYQAHRRDDADWMQITLFFAECLLVSSVLAAVLMNMAGRWLGS